MQKIAVIIPCFNEAKRLSPETFLRFLNDNIDFDLHFVNDGSSDATGDMLSNMQVQDPTRVHVLTSEKNMGKSHAVRAGILKAAQISAYDSFGYLDADLSTSLEEFKNLHAFLQEKQASFVAGSRVKMVNTHITRSAFRHVTGRALATIIDSRFKLGIYDTQCGAKCFTRELCAVFTSPFHTRWLFDIEVFLRIRKMFPDSRLMEKPLSAWKEPGASRLNIFHFPLITKEIISLLRHYGN